MSIKICLKCKAHKTLKEFGTRKRNSDGKRGRCKDCEKEDRGHYLLRPENKLKNKKAQRRWYVKNRAYTLKRHREWAAENYEHLFNYRRRTLLKKTYGLTMEQYQAMEEAQDHRCKICRSENPGLRYKHFFIDHCHKTGKIRGLLCTHCNLAIGQMGDDAERILRAADYVKYMGDIP